MNSTEMIQALTKPFPASAVEWRLQHILKDKEIGLAVPYIDSRAIQSRLDDIFGPLGWQNTFTAWQGTAQLCGISVLDQDRGEWITKHDGAPNTDIEPVKGGLSDALKRTAVQWGIGRYLYGMEGVWVAVDDKKRIKKGEQAKLDAAYEKAVQQLTDGGHIDAPEPPANPPIGAGNVTPLFPDLYTVTSAKTNTGDSGVSTTLHLTDPKGNPIKAYIWGKNDRLISGVKLQNVKFTQKTGAYGPYTLVDAYEIVA